ncbi:excinuclease ABC subunit C [Candidatus Gracilibacteria bacterium]|nr:excinuclease ABC subunit C [Candidatus Gracilibacteria bacterium]
MKKIPEHIAHILQNLPKTPGVYQMKDKTGKIIYVGKAKNLRSRVSSYFREGQDLTVAKRNMVGQIADIETILCQTEVEALVLETNLIKHFSPKYNILMKDDKNLSYLKITTGKIPELIKTRQKINDGAKYFGPFTQGMNLSENIKSLRRMFKIRACKMKFADIGGKITITDKAGRGVPCMDYYIGICPAPCLLKEQNIAEHNQNISHLQEFLSGKTNKILENLREKMQFFAKNLEFEKAQKIKEEIAAIEMFSERQIARDMVDGDVDACVILEKYNQIFVGLTSVRDGKIIGVFRSSVDAKGAEISEVFSQFLVRQYSDDFADIPKILIVEKNFDDEILEAFLQMKKIQILTPQIGTKKELLDFTKNQVREFAYKKELQSLENNTLTRGHMEQILERLKYSIPKKGPIFFECYDISHTHGQFTYASRVVIKNGKPDTDNYKKYKIKSLRDGEIDDFASHQEVMMRRTIEGLGQRNFPNLIIIDGGKGQLSSALEGIFLGIEKFLSENNPEKLEKFLSEKSENLAIQWQKISEILGGEVGICSIAKREEEVFLPGQKNPILFEKGTPELMVIQKARDESHRFSITANRNARGKSMKKNILEELPGIGPTTRKKLLKTAGSIDEIKNLDETEILKIVNKKQLETLRDHGLF